MATKTKTKRKPKATLKELNVNFKHKENICEFIQDNIAQINNNIGSFDNNACKNAKLEFDATDIKKNCMRVFYTKLNLMHLLKKIFGESLKKKIT